MPLAQANPPLVGARGRPKTRGKWPRARLILPNAGLREYYDRVLHSNPRAYWPLNEISGIVANCLVDPLQNGAYNTDVSGWPPGTGIGDGNTAPFFDGANDFVDLTTAACMAAADTAATEGSIAAWYKVFNVGVWTDATYRAVYAFVDDASNRYTWYKSGTANEVYALHYAGGTGETHAQAGQTATTWQHCALTWSETEDEVKYYLNGGLLATDTTIGNWAGDGTWAPIMIGAVSFAPGSVWHGWIAHVSLYDRVLGLPEVLSLATV